MLKQPLDDDRDFLTKLFSGPVVMQHIWDGPLDWNRAARYAHAIIGLTQFSINHGWWVVSQLTGIVESRKFHRFFVSVRKTRPGVGRTLV